MGEYLENEYQMEIENRVRNLMWTVSGDYSLDVELDVDSFQKSRYISLYDAIKQGAFARYFDKDALALYVVKKSFLGADQMNLMNLAQICVDAAVHKRVEAERSGVADIRKKAFSDLIEFDYRRLSESLTGMLKLAFFKRALDPGYRTTKKLSEALSAVEELEGAAETMELIRTVDRLYNSLLDQTFEERQGSLEEVLSVTLEELAEYGWKDFLKENAETESFDDYMRRLTQSMLRTESGEEAGQEEKEEKEPGAPHVVQVTEEDLKKVYSYVELNFGKSYLSPLESRRMDYRLCRGAHGDCSLYFTEGILKNSVKNNYQYQYALRQAEQNRRVYAQNHNLARKNITILTDVLRQALVRRSETEYVRDDHGHVVPKLLWKVGRTNDRRLFTRTLNRNAADFVVDVLIDASGSQRVRQPKVALQGYIISRALSNVGIPHRVMSFCSFWDYTVLHRFRDYDEDRSADKNIMEYTTSSNNRDGLAIRAAADGLLKRQEENKVLIVLSDGRPNDIIVNRPNSKNPRSYGGDYAVKDTAREVRHARNMGISVLGVFAGKEIDLNAEKKIFGKDFAYIRDIANFSNVVGTYLKRQLDADNL
ncbi:cobaltochelatase CobT-related protein [Fusibacillus kribbianus]|uniref:Nitric oxide reductase activation protein n=1 Tax=Fusibacillus kribbianus TaxID=3044208 RepID=A0AAP4B871_9FIRM|nr:nitric oxide reductase activation protein [Ruminococcus sp. YH-rum2234]MDI9241022.1 nitric oxide reductase activation protein [Ruminococcus sp. YH-rum2234]